MADVDLHEMGGRVLSVFGPFGSRTLIELPTEVAETLFPDGLALSGRTEVVTATERDVAAIATRDRALAESALAATAVAMAYELQDPFNSATSKSMCAGKLMEVLEQLRALAPAVERKDDLDGIKSRAALSLVGGSAAKD